MVLYDDAMQLSFANPDRALRPYITAYYLFEDDAAVIADTQRADCGHIRFFLDGHGFQTLPNGEHMASTPIMLMGPHSKYSHFNVQGPLRFAGCSLMPCAWGGLLRCEASSLLDGACDGASFLAVEDDDLIARLAQCRSIEGMAPILDAVLLQRISDIPPEHIRVNGTIQAWLKSSLFPDVQTLYAACKLGERQVSRIGNRYWGAPPKALSRKYGALRTASHILKNDGAVPDEARHHYSDASHLIREVKRVTGMTPRQLKSISNMILRITLDETHFRELNPIP
jgi:AraC-like DNA-binding protein